MTKRLQAFLLKKMFNPEKVFKSVTLSEFKIKDDDDRFISNIDEEGLPPRNSRHKITISLDLDNTLLHVEEGGTLVFRPYAIQFLQKIKKLEGIEIIAWTASKYFHCNRVVQALEKNSGVKFDYILFCHDSVDQHKAGFHKDFKHTNRDPETFIHVDDNTYICRNINHVTYVIAPFFSHNGIDTNLIYCYDDILQHIAMNKKGKVSKLNFMI